MVLLRCGTGRPARHRPHVVVRAHVRYPHLDPPVLVRVEIVHDHGAKLAVQRLRHQVPLARSRSISPRRCTGQRPMGQTWLPGRRSARPWVESVVLSQRPSGKRLTMSDELLQVGVESEDVLDVQGRLLFLGYDPGQVSGHFSTETEAAVMQYQQATGQSPTGTLDPFAVQHLREYTNAHHYGQPPNAEHHHTAHHTAHHGHGDQGLTADQWQIAEAQLGGAATVHVEPGSEVEASPGDYYDNLHHTLNNVSTRAIAQAAHNDAALIRACQAFKSEYAMPRLHELEGRITGEDLAKQVTRSLMDMAGIRVCGAIGSGVAKWFAEQVSVGLARKASAAAKSAVSNEGTAKALAASFEHIITEAETHNAVYAETARELMAQALAPVFDRIQVRQPLA